MDDRVLYECMLEVFWNNFKIFRGALLLLISCITGWKHTHIETTEAEYAHQQRKELHDRVYQQNISDEGLFSFFEELISKSSQNWPFVSLKSVHAILSMQLANKCLEVTSNKQQALRNIKCN